MYVIISVMTMCIMLDRRCAGGLMDPGRVSLRWLEGEGYERRNDGEIGRGGHGFHPGPIRTGRDVDGGSHRVLWFDPERPKP